MMKPAARTLEPLNKLIVEHIEARLAHYSAHGAAEVGGQLELASAQVGEQGRHVLPVAVDEVTAVRVPHSALAFAQQRSEEVRSTRSESGVCRPVAQRVSGQSATDWKGGPGARQSGKYA